MFHYWNRIAAAAGHGVYGVQLHNDFANADDDEEGSTEWTMPAAEMAKERVSSPILVEIEQIHTHDNCKYHATHNCVTHTRDTGGSASP